MTSASGASNGSIDTFSDWLNGGADTCTAQDCLHGSVGTCTGSNSLPLEPGIYW